MKMSMRSQIHIRLVQFLLRITSPKTNNSYASLIAQNLSVPNVSPSVLRRYCASKVLDAMAHDELFGLLLRPFKGRGKGAAPRAAMTLTWWVTFPPDV